ncbi:unnamed protein product [Arctogadus glacialis]
MTTPPSPAPNLRGSRKSHCCFILQTFGESNQRVHQVNGGLLAPPGRLRDVPPGRRTHGPPPPTATRGAVDHSVRRRPVMVIITAGASRGTVDL